MVTYSVAAIDAQLNALGTALSAGSSAGGALVLASSGVALASFSLANPTGSAAGGVFTFAGLPLTAIADATGNANAGWLQDGAGNRLITNLSVGIPLSSADIVMSNGLNTTAISSGQTVQVLSATIGS